MMKRYEHYKDSGVEWIGEIPADWEVKRFKYIFDLVTDKAEEELLKIGLENIESETGKFIETNTDFDGDGIQFIPDDILFGKLRPYLAKVYLSNFQGQAVGDFFVFRSKGAVSASFGSKIILSQRFIDIVNGSTFGSKMPRASWDYIANLRLAYPEINEQTTIANYLDRKTSAIDALIAQKERLIALYEEEKTAIINHAVTKGINPEAKLKDSGIEWLGEIPEGWEVWKLGHLYRVVRGGSPRPAGSPLYFNGTHTPWITVGELTKDKSKFLTKTKDFLTEEGRKQSRVIKPNTMLLSNSGATLGVPKITLIEGCINDGSVAFLNTPLNVDDSFIYYYLSGLTFHLRMLVQVSGQPNLNTDLVKGLCVGLPSKGEQSTIVQHIETETASIDSKIAKTKRIIELQKEYRASLISEVVTGKLKVSHLANQEVGL